MANLGKMFDPNAQQPSVLGGSQLPVSDKTGWPMIIIDSEMKSTQNDANQGYLKVTVQIIEGEHAGCEGSTNFNLFNNNEITVSIAEKQLTSLAYSVGIYQPFADSVVLHNKPFRGVVGLQKVKPGQEDKGFTEIKGYLDINGNPPAKGGSTTAASAPPVAPPTPPVAPATPPTQPVAPVQPQAAAPEVAPAGTPWTAPQTTPVPEQAPAAPQSWQQNPVAAGGAATPPPWQK